MDRFLLYFTLSGGTGGDARRSIAFAPRWDGRGPVAPLLLRPGGTGGGPSLHCFCAPVGRAGARRSICFCGAGGTGGGARRSIAFAPPVGRAGARRSTIHRGGYRWSIGTYFAGYAGPI